MVITRLRAVTTDLTPAVCMLECTLSQDPNWMMTKEKLGTAKFMHCLPVRRNVVVEDAVLDSNQSVVIEQANNRTYAAQVVLKNILENR